MKLFSRRRVPVLALCAALLPAVALAATGAIPSVGATRHPHRDRPPQVSITDVTIRVPHQDPVEAWLVAPAGHLRKHSTAGVLWLHWLGQIHNDRSRVPLRGGRPRRRRAWSRCSRRATSRGSPNPDGTSRRRHRWSQPGRGVPGRPRPARSHPGRRPGPDRRGRPRLRRDVRRAARRARPPGVGHGAGRRRTRVGQLVRDVLARPRGPGARGLLRAVRRARPGRPRRPAGLATCCSSGPARTTSCPRRCATRSSRPTRTPRPSPTTRRPPAHGRRHRGPRCVPGAQLGLGLSRRWMRSPGPGRCTRPRAGRRPSPKLKHVLVWRHALLLRRGDDPGGVLRTPGPGREAAGYTSMTIADSLIYPQESDSKYPYTDTGDREFLLGKEFIETFILCAHLFAVTETLRLTPFVLKLPVRPPVLVAKQASSLAFLSGNRLGLGVGLSPWPEDFAALGVPWEKRGKRMDECMDILRGLTQPAGELLRLRRRVLRHRAAAAVPGSDGDRSRCSSAATPTPPCGAPYSRATGGCTPAVTARSSTGCSVRLAEIRKEEGDTRDDFEVHVISYDAYTPTASSGSRTRASPTASSASGSPTSRAPTPSRSRRRSSTSSSTPRTSSRR